MKFLLKDRALLRITGVDAKKFLQSQFSNNIENIKSQEVQINAYCQHQGKILGLLWVFVMKDNFYISLPSDLKQTILSKLNLFKLMSKVEIEDCSKQIYQFGIIDEEYDNSFKISQNLSLLTSRKLIDSNTDLNIWEKSCIDTNLPEIFSTTSEKFIPQALNLDIEEYGVSFTKGCYPGQEVVARMHYLGKPKRRLFKFISKFKASVGDSIDVNDSSSLKPSGTVLRVSKIDAKYYLLGTFEIKHINDMIYLNNDTHKPLVISNG